MTAPKVARTGRGAGAPAHDEVDWQAIVWLKAYRSVRRLQARIVPATQAGRWNKVKALQRLLTHSHSGKVLAVRRVTENPGKVHSQRLTVVKPRPAQGRKRGLSCLRGNSPEQFLGG
jgi:N-terminal domain of reverse transcriptase